MPATYANTGTLISRETCGFSQRATSPAGISTANAAAPAHTGLTPVCQNAYIKAPCAPRNPNSPIKNSTWSSYASSQSPIQHSASAKSTHRPYGVSRAPPARAIATNAVEATILYNTRPKKRLRSAAK